MLTFRPILTGSLGAIIGILLVATLFESTGGNYANGASLGFVAGAVMATRPRIQKLLLPHDERPDFEKRSWCRRVGGIWDIASGIRIPANRNFGILRLTIIGTEVLLLISPAVLWQTVLHAPFRRDRKLAMDVFVAIKPVVLFLFLRLERADSGWAMFFALWFLADLYLYWISILLVGDLFDGFVAIQRTLVLLVFNVVEQILAFSIFYIHEKAIDPDCINAGWQQVFYFSALTAATADHPTYKANADGHGLVVLQVFMTLALVAIAAAYTVSRLSENKNTHRQFPTSIDR